MAHFNMVKLKQLSVDLDAKISSVDNAINENINQLEERMANLNAEKVKQVSEDLDEKISKNI
jgi:gas vesicle protein